ncbi:hypothetical protein ZIOFF_045055 [Zingiber officinale]|uniref:Retrotransposon gag domain-containing protein n=1 Tax=Zingiber officinale TaxID=94328 RepID=A0A8J5G2A8_ZINOF|nr:hypothetical protein ZIOFF_045055 [Zingiber officinale]
MVLTLLQEKKIYYDMMTGGSHLDTKWAMEFEAKHETRMDKLEKTMASLVTSRQQQYDHRVNSNEDQERNPPCMKVEFPRWENNDLIGWISRAEKYFCFHSTSDYAKVELASINLEGDVIQWYDWFEACHGPPEWEKFKEKLLNRFGPSDYEHGDGELTKIRQTTTVLEYQGRFERLSNRTRDWSKKLTKEEIKERMTKGLCWHCDEKWHCGHQCKQKRILMIEPIENSKEEDDFDEGETQDNINEVQYDSMTISVHALEGLQTPQTMKTAMETSDAAAAAPVMSSFPSPSSSSSSSDFEFTVSVSPAASKRSCPADELFYKGQLLPLHPSTRICMRAKEVIKKYVKKVRPIYEKLSAMQQKNKKKPTTFSFSDRLFPGKKNTPATGADAAAFSQSSFSGNLFGLHPPARKERWAASCPSSMRSSPSHSGLLYAGDAPPAASLQPSSMEELQSAIQSAIAHCKNSLTQPANHNEIRTTGP